MIKSIPVPAVLLVSLMIISCKPGEKKGIVQVTGKPGIYFENTEHDFGDIAYDSEAIYQFEFVNNGDEALLITNVKTSCGCTASEYSKKPYKPGEKGEITVEYDTRRTGRFSKSITVYSNTGEDATILKIEGNVDKKPETKEEKE